MGGFQFNGCGAKDYFSKVKYLGEQMCPNCKSVTPFYLEKGSFKVSVFWIPTVTLKDRYAIMCEKCNEGKWIEDAEAHKILSGNAYIPTEFFNNTSETALPKCRHCGADVDGVFCGICGAKFAPEEVSNDTDCVEDNVSDSTKKRICPECGSEVPDQFCSKCGTKYPEPDTDKSKLSKICPKCGAQVDELFCGICGTKYIAEEEPVIPVEDHDSEHSTCDTEGDNSFHDEDCSEHQEISDTTAETDNQSKKDTVEQNWECSLCGTKNPQGSSKCSLCGCEK